MKPHLTHRVPTIFDELAINDKQLDANYVRNHNWPKIFGTLALSVGAVGVLGVALPYVMHRVEQTVVDLNNIGTLGG